VRFFGKAFLVTLASCVDRGESYRSVSVAEFSLPISAMRIVNVPCDVLRQHGAVLWDWALRISGALQSQKLKEPVGCFFFFFLVMTFGF